MKERPLYHGSTYKITAIDLSECKGYKDFGKGFYASSNKQQAEGFARIKKRRKDRVPLLERPDSKDVHAYCNKLIFYEDAAFADDNLKIKVFRSADLEWVKFLYANRKVRNGVHSYDIVIGPTADDATAVIISRYEQPLRQSNYADAVYEELIQELHPEKLKRQYCFCTRKSLKYIKMQVHCPWEVVE